MKSRAFTLIEILVVIVMIAVLGVLLTPVFKRVIATGHSTSCLSNLRQIGMGLSAYLTEHDNQMPVLKTARDSKADEVPVIDNTLDKFLTDRKVFACPADRKYAALTGTSYVWNVALNGQTLGNLNFVGVVEEHSRIPLMADKEGFHPYTENKVNILYADGHATKELKFTDQ
jgi:prepilin-type N-terminal cleavage/methylation domain-containing protein/prepilin-type processing-associated H-X9-DG protein